MVHSYSVFFTRTIIIVLCVGLWGCGKAQPPVAEVNGTVTYQGKPVVSGRVLFLPDGGGKQGLGLIQSDGTFELGTFGTNDGALLGKHHVMLVRVALTNRTTELESFSKAAGQDVIVQPDKVNVVDVDLSTGEWQRLDD